jgi:hypothetical protein
MLTDLFVRKDKAVKSLGVYNYSNQLSSVNSFSAIQLITENFILINRDMINIPG